MVLLVVLLDGAEDIFIRIRIRIRIRYLPGVRGILRGSGFRCG